MITSIKEIKNYHSTPHFAVDVEWHPTKNETQIDHLEVTATSANHMHIGIYDKAQTYISVGNSRDYHISAHVTNESGEWKLIDRMYITKRGSFSAYDSIPTTHRAKLESLVFEVAKEFADKMQATLLEAETKAAQYKVEQKQGQIKVLQADLAEALEQLKTLEAELDIAVLHYNRFNVPKS